jgi:acetyl esterase/lipase
MILVNVADFVTRAATRVADVYLHLLARVPYMQPAANPARYGVRLIRNVDYGGTRKRYHRLDVYRPAAKNLRPCVLYIHGGGFAMLSKETHRVMALAFSSQGFVVFNANYRLGPKHHYPAPLEDAAAALLWVQEHAEEYGGDPSRIVLAGESAGANLVTALAYIATHPRPEPFARAVFDRNPSIRAVLPTYGLLDVEDVARFLNHPRMSVVLKLGIIRAASAYVGRPIRTAAVRAPLASPLARLAEPPPDGARPLPPFFVAVGTADPLLVDSKRLREVIRARGGVCELSVHPNEIHGFDAMIWRREARLKWKRTFEFLSQHVRYAKASNGNGAARRSMN